MGSNTVNRREKRSKKRSELRSWISDYKKNLKCERCGFSHPAALQFHHTDSSIKKFAISEAAGLEKSLQQVQEEINKCEVICANCHMVHHHEERVELEAARFDEELWYNELSEDDLFYDEEEI